MENIDVQLFYWLNHLPDSLFTKLLFYIHYLGFVWIFILTVFLWITYPKKRIILVKGFLVTIFTYGLGIALKFLIDRPRPFEALADVTVRADYSFPSFPSNQVAAFFAFATLLLIFFPKKWYTAVTFVIVVLVATSRVYVGAHYPSDVIGGIVLGCSVPIVYHVISNRKTAKK